MSKRVLVIFGITILAVAVTAYWLGHRSADPMSTAVSTATNPANDKKVLFWYDPMVPNTHFDKPGKSPFMDMQLVPMYDEPNRAQGNVAIDPRMRQNLGIRTATVTAGSIAQRIETVGYVEPDQRKIAIVQTRVQGWVERLAVAAVNDPVRKGQVLMEVYSPDLMAAQAEYLLASRDAAQPDGQMLAHSARSRLALLGLTEEQIRELGVARRIDRRIAYLAPVNGVVMELNVRVGAQVSPGMNVLSLVDLASVWVIAELPETQSAWVRPGATAQVMFSAYPKRKFDGSVEYVYPEVTQASRTLRARIRLDNRDGILKPGMYASVSISGTQSRDELVVPSEAIIATGKRKVVIVVEADGGFRPANVETGAESGGKTEILAGLVLGQRVVTSGQFLLDSESNMRSGLQRLEAGEDAVTGKTGAPVLDERAAAHTTRGIVKSVNPAPGSITIAHEPIAELKWPSMTMDFSVTDKKLLQRIQPNQRIEFDFIDQGDGKFVVTAIRPVR